MDRGCVLVYDNVSEMKLWPGIYAVYITDDANKVLLQ